MNERIRLRESCNANKQSNICVCAETVHVLFSLSSGLWRNILAARFQDEGQVSCPGCDTDGSEDYLIVVQHLQSFMVTLHEFVAALFFQCIFLLKQCEDVTWNATILFWGYPSASLTNSMPHCADSPVFMCVVLFRTDFSFIGKS